ncbi:hypothetical protein ITJ57_16310 [Plantibacter sp. VKM Ac-2880]|uniref:hypothetical protein n=1 Tax=Plantibacter sp. VKM Ac-2880 TaxID=2783827 RepID=UPI00188DE90C|nr:hypothetical protein [Plantibacter sp. VKM Ac-2880]MBF4570333.1 hypothetical protein [Plantibacter sp. VKM Ac-2880]
MSDHTEASMAEVPAGDAPGRRRTYPRWWLIVLAVALVLVGGACVAGIILFPTDAKRAISECQDDVLGRLKSPSTAQFTEVEIQTDDDAREIAAARPIQDDENPIFIIEGRVDAQNAFSAMVRSTFTCTTQKFGPVWTTDSVLYE